MSEKLIVESRVKELLLAATKAKSVGQEVLDMLSEGVRTAATTTIMGMCRVTPGGRLLLAPTLPPYAEVERRVMAQDPLPVADDYASLPGIKRPVPERLCARAKETLAANGGERRGFPVAEAEMDAYADWKYECSNGDTLLGFREWQEARAERLKEATEIEMTDKAARKGVGPEP